MTELAYIPRHFRKCVKYKDLIKFNELKNQSLVERSCLEAYGKVAKDAEWDNAIDIIKVKSKNAYTINNVATALINNVLINNIGSKYNIKSVDRDYTIKLLVSHIKDSYAYSIHRLDVKSFYESFDRRSIITKLKSDAKLSRKTISILEHLFSKLNTLNVEGLPRGMGISSALSELMMKDFDQYIRTRKSVLFYSRFVDDIIILGTPILTKNKLEEMMQSSPFPSGLELHKSGKKVAYRPVKKTSEDNSKIITKFDYLGYEFKINNFENEIGNNLSIKRRVLDIEISDEKINKLKGRIINSFCCLLSTKKSKNVKLSTLRKRLDFLSKNYPLVNSSDNSQIMSGIYYNYKHASNNSKLNQVDIFYKSILFGNFSNLSKRLKKEISYKDRVSLSKISFSEGFSEKRFCKFSFKEFKDIKRAWIQK